MTPSSPPRLRDIEAAAHKPARRRKQRIYLLGLLVLVPLTLLLAYGLLRQSLIRPSVDATIDESDMVVRAGEQIQVEVINACGVDGVARRFTDFLRARQFDVAETNTSRTPERMSLVIDRVGDRRSAQKVAYALGIPDHRIQTLIDSSLFLRATVVVGEDYRTLRPMK